jgi:hypothetical protein
MHSSFKHKEEHWTIQKIKHTVKQNVHNERNSCEFISMYLSGSNRFGWIETFHNNRKIAKLRVCETMLHTQEPFDINFRTHS